ncbi:MAG TPA: 2-amino-4-hydroxy-6-hydroxymethyldihydropteridine diphosphokinase [Rudaea sp.]|jgi:2-amino-4-hydroxy-6-hydroxymethyldihydropteridine diphosphokinase
MTAPPRRIAWVGLGSNLAGPREQVELGLDALAHLPRSQLRQRSHLYRSAPWGVRDQPEFVNAVAAIQTGLAPHELMAALLEIELSFGRERNADRWGPRILDLDLLLYADRIIDEPGLRVPHPRLHERAFVLSPLAEIAPHLQIPGRGSISDLIARVDVSECRRLE